MRSGQGPSLDPSNGHPYYNKLPWSKDKETARMQIKSKGGGANTGNAFESRIEVGEGQCVVSKLLESMFTFDLVQQLRHLQFFFGVSNFQSALYHTFPLIMLRSIFYNASSRRQTQYIEHVLEQSYILLLVFFIYLRRFIISGTYVPSCCLYYLKEARLHIVFNR